MESTQGMIFGQAYHWQKKICDVCPRCSDRAYQECYTFEDGLIGYECDSCGYADSIYISEDDKDDPPPPEPGWDKSDDYF